MREFDLIVIGGGPAGMMAAGTAARRGVKVALIEKMEKLGRKLRITGKGRCNLTNSKTQEEILEKVRANAEFFSHSLKEFSNMDTIDFFERNGLEISIERGGRVFPASGKAWDVADCLKEWIEESGVSIFYNSKVCAIERNGSIGYKLIVTEKSETWSYYCKKIIIATGGVSYPATGSTGDGYLLANRMGHRIEEVRPALVALETDKKYLPELKRLELKNVNLDLIIDGQSIDERFGQMMFTEFGIDGPIVLQLSRQIVDALIEERDVVLSLDLKPTLSKKTLQDRIAREIEDITRGGMVKVLMEKMMPRPMIRPVCTEAGVDPKLFVDKLTEEQKMALINTMKDFRLQITDYRPFEEAIVTAGGVDCSQINPRTLESRIEKGIYFAGEVMDIDADTGGYNLQIAFSTGYVAGLLK
jgi:predicted Rossmann fold flavoprotein